MSTLNFAGSAQARKRNSPYDNWIEAGNQGTEEDFELYLHGYTSSQVRLLKKYQTAPTQTYAQEGGSDVQYTFETGAVTFSGSDAGWSVSPPAGTGDLYAIYASALSKDAYDVIEPDEWTFPSVLSTEGTPGQPGRNVTTVFVFKASTTQPAAPTGTITYNFNDGTVSGLSGGWSKTDTSGDKVWISSATASSIDTTATLTGWSAPTVWKQKGDTGVGLTQPTEEYAVNNDSTNHPQSGWTTFSAASAQLDETHRFLWNKETMNYSDGTSSQNPSYHIVYRYTIDGTNAKNITGVDEWYAYGTISAPDAATWDNTATKTPSESHPYVWQKERVIFDDSTYGSFATAHLIAMWVKGDQGDEGPQGITPKVLDIKLDSQTFVRNDRRLTGGTDIIIEAIVSGYEGYNDIEWTSSEGTISDDKAQITHLIIPYTTDSKVSLTLTISKTVGAITLTEHVDKEIDYIDQTEWDKSYGCISAIPDEVPLLGDSFVASVTFGPNDKYVKGIPYYWDGDSWEEVDRGNTVVKNRFELLGAALDSDITIPSSSVLYQWVGSLVAMEIFADYIEANFVNTTKLKALIAEIEDLVVNNTAQFKGTVVSDVLETVLQQEIGNQVTSTISVSSNANAIRGHEVKSNVLGRAKAVLTTYTAYSATTTEGFFGRYDFDKVMRTPNTVSITATAKATLSPDLYSEDDTLSWTNTYPVPVKIYTSYAPKSYTEVTVDWALYSGPTSEVGFIDPAQFVTDRPENPDMNEVWWDVYDISGPNASGKYFWKERYWRYQVVNTYISYGDVKVYIDNVEQSKPSAGKSYTLQPSSTVRIDLKGAYGAVNPDDTYDGAASIMWRESENFQAENVLFINGTTPKFYLSDITENFYTSTIDLKIGNDWWLNLAVGSNTWTYSSSYTTIYRYKKFRWDSSIGGSKTANMFSGNTTMYLTGVYQGNEYIGTVGSSQTTYTPASITYNDGYANIVINNNTYIFDGETYLVSSSISFTPISKSLGVYAKTILPLLKGTYNIGSSSQADGIFNHFGYVNGSSQGKANPNDQFKVWGAVFN